MFNQTQFEITQKIHQELNKLAKTTGIKVDLRRCENFWYEVFDCNGKITQIVYNKFKKLDNTILEKLYFKEICESFESLEFLFILHSFKEKTPNDFSLSEFYEKCFNNSNSLFDQNPTQVLIELLEILQNIK